jgi:hypothetical protein
MRNSLDNIEFPPAVTDVTLTHGVLYNHRPSFWKHPIRWLRHEQQVIGVFDLQEPIEMSGLTVTFEETGTVDISKALPDDLWHTDDDGTDTLVKAGSVDVPVTGSQAAGEVGFFAEEKPAPGFWLRWKRRVF